MRRYSLQSSLGSCDVWTPSNLQASPHFACTGHQLDLWNRVKQLILIFSLCTFSSFVTYLAGGSRGPQASCTGSCSNSEGWSECNEPERAQQAGSSLECPYHCLQRTAGRDRRGSQGMMGETVHTGPEKWRHFRPTHPVSISIMDGGPLPAVIAESQVVGRHKVAPETRRTGDTCKHLYVGFFLAYLSFLFCVSLSDGVSSLCYDSCELCVPPSVQLKPVDPVVCVCAPCSTSHVILIIWTLGTTQATTQAAVTSFWHDRAPQKNVGPWELELNNNYWVNYRGKTTWLDSDRNVQRWGNVWKCKAIFYFIVLFNTTHIMKVNI